MSSDINTPKEAKIENDIPYENCLNCGTELKGRFCHKCGQEAVSKTPTVGSFIHEYIGNSYNWDAQFLKTLWNLVRHPGFLTKEYNAGKFISQEHPLKLNMFLLFVFATIFLLFSNSNEEIDPINEITKDEVSYPSLQMEYLMMDEEFAARVYDSPRDTVLMHAPLRLVDEHSAVISKISVSDDTQSTGLDRWVAVVPRVLIDDRIIIQGEDEHYRFNTEEEVIASSMAMFQDIWDKMTDITTSYFPLFMLLSAPLLSIALSFIQRKRKQPIINHVIFALHYTAFIELLILFIYILYLTIDPSMNTLQWIIRIGAITYLIIAFRTVYEPNSWVKAIFKAIFTYIVYLFNCIFLLLVILIITCIVVIAMSV